MLKEICVLNTGQCLSVADSIKKLVLRNSFYNREYLQIFAPEETLFRMHFFAVVICHQTHLLHHPVLNLFGWDYLEHVFVRLVREHSILINPLILATLTPGNLATLLKPEFSHDENPENCTLDRLEERAALMIEASQKIIELYGGKLAKFLATCNGFLLNNGYGFYELLPDFEAFSDPLQKKSTFLIKLLMEAGLLQIKDAQHFIPIMDYHMQRVLLRLGCVEITDETYRKRLLNHEILTTDEPVRSQCVEAFTLIAQHSGHIVTKMNDFFWSLGRSCCHKTTLCTDHVCEKSPCTFTQIVEAGTHSRCIFQEICKGANNEKYRYLWQPIVETHYY